MNATTRRSNYADRAHSFRLSATAAREAGDLDHAGDLEDMATRAETAHAAQPWRSADDLRYDSDDCCIECHEHLSDPHQPECLYADVSYATA